MIERIDDMPTGTIGLPRVRQEPLTVREARENPELVATMSIDDVVAHYTEIIQSLEAKPIIVGHSFGALFAEKLLGQDLAVAAVAIDPAQRRPRRPPVRSFRLPWRITPRRRSTRATRPAVRCC